MILERLSIPEHPVLQWLEMFIVTQEVPPVDDVRERGDLVQDIATGPPPAAWPPQVTNRPLAYKFAIIDPGKRPGWMPEGVRFSSANYFPAGGGLGWHSDYQHPGWRVFFGTPCWRTHPGVLHLPNFHVYDSPGVATAFYISGKPGDSWHAVHTPGPRFSAGLRFDTDERARELFGLRVSR